MLIKKSSWKLMNQRSGESIMGVEFRTRKVVKIKLRIDNKLHRLYGKRILKNLYFQIPFH